MPSSTRAPCSQSFSIGDGGTNDPAPLHPDFIPDAVRERAMVALEKAYANSPALIARLRVLLKLAELQQIGLTDRLKRELNDLSGGLEDYGHYLLRPALEIIRSTDPQWVSDWVAQRVGDGSLWREGWTPLIANISQEFKDSLLQRFENEQDEHARFGGPIAVLAAVADPALAERIFSKLFELRRSAREVQYDFESTVERRLDALLRAISPNIAVDGLSGHLERPVDGN